jgi:hypothetical protein
MAFSPQATDLPPLRRNSSDIYGQRVLRGQRSEFLQTLISVF